MQINVLPLVEVPARDKYIRQFDLMVFIDGVRYHASYAMAVRERGANEQELHAFVANAVRQLVLEQAGKNVPIMYL